MKTQVQVKTKLDTYYLTATEKGLISLDWEKNPELPLSRKGNLHTDLARDQLMKYSLGQLKKFNCEFDFESMKATDFQIKVWKELLKVPYGKVVCYQDIARKLGDKNLVRAIGGANGKNRIPVIIPCHRVIAKDGTIGGYSGGLDRKRKFLNREGINLD